MLKLLVEASISWLPKLKAATLKADPAIKLKNPETQHGLR